MSIEIDYIEVGGKPLAAHKAICPVCRMLDMDTTFDVSLEPWKAKCSLGHEWDVNQKADA